MFTVPYSYTVNALLSPQGGLFNFGYSRGGLIREEGLFKKLDEEAIYDSFISFLPHILPIQDAILRVKYIDSTDFYHKLYQNLRSKAFKQSRKKILGSF